jgi:hypothetical protein
MPIDEIEIPGSSFSVKCWTARIESIPALFDKLMQEGEVFNLDEEKPGFHDCDTNGRLIRGFYSAVIPFEVEHLVDGISTKSLFKRIESCEFFAVEDCLFATGRSGPQKGLSGSLSGLSGYGVSQMEFEFQQLSQFHDRLKQLKAIVLTNPKDKEIKRARLTGHIENYTEYNVIDARNHGIDSVSGLSDTPLGPMTLTVTRKGGLRLGVRKGFLLTIDCLRWILHLIREDKPPAPRQVSLDTVEEQSTGGKRGKKGDPSQEAPF